MMFECFCGDGLDTNQHKAIYRQHAANIIPTNQNAATVNYSAQY